MSSYSELLRHPKWQKRSAEIKARDEWQCAVCHDPNEQTHVHHKWYDKDTDPWNYPDDALITLCEDCHNATEQVIRDFRMFIGRHPVGLMRSFLENLSLCSGLGLSERDMVLVFIHLMNNPNRFRDIKEQFELEALEKVR